MLEGLLAEDIMCDHPIKVKENVNVGTVAHLLFRYRINGILVVSKEDENRVIGVFTTTDLLRLIDRLLSKGIRRIEVLRRIAGVCVGEVATKEPYSVQRDTKLTKIVAIMHRKNIHTIPVYDKDKLVGVIGRHDIINIVFSYY